tara:strand:+ start:8842 stop:9378 length:537 start_codon:yes stop_codon:yes gene_type:complete
MNVNMKLFALACTLGAVFAQCDVAPPSLQEKTQHVYIISDEPSEDGLQRRLVVGYNADDETLPGLGLRTHYDSDMLLLNDISEVLVDDHIFTSDVVIPDEEDHDDDEATDAFILAAWASLFNSWPGTAPVELMTLTFDVVDMGQESPVRFTTVSQAAGFEFAGREHHVCADGHAFHPW